MPQLPRPSLPGPSVTPPVMMEQVVDFAAASGDDNPIHLSPEAAHSAGLEGPVLHGMFISGRFEVYLEQIEGFEIAELRVNFVRPAPLGSALMITSRAIQSPGPYLRLRLLASVEGVGLVAVAEAGLAPASDPAR